MYEWHYKVKKKKTLGETTDFKIGELRLPHTDNRSNNLRQL